MDDVTLVERGAAGDETAFELLVRRHTDAVWRFARSCLADDFAAEEAVQDTFVKAYRAGDVTRGVGGRTWLLAICHRTCIDAGRRRRATVVSLDEARRARAREEHHELRLALSHGIATLPAAERRAFQLVDVLGYSREEAAEIVGVPASTMRSRVARARKRMMAALGGAACWRGWRPNGRRRPPRRQTAAHAWPRPVPRRPQHRLPVPRRGRGRHGGRG